MTASIRNNDASKSFIIYVVDQNTGKLRRTAIPSDLQVGLKDAPAELQIHGRLSVSSDELVVSARSHGTVYVDPNDTIVNVESTVIPASGRISVVLPSNPRDGQLVIIKDSAGTGASTPLDVTPSNNYLIDDALSGTISTAYGTLGVYWHGDQWRKLFALGTTTTTSSSSGSGDGADKGASYIVITNTASLPNERRLFAGTGIAITDNGPGSTVVIEATGTAVGGGDPGASYVVIGLTSSLSNERRLAAGSGISIVDNGANSTVVISADSVTGSWADVSASYITIGNTGSLPNERRLAGGTGIILSDGGAGSSIAVEINDNVVATISGSRFNGPVVAAGGLSGSLQTLIDGTSYLVGVGAVTITSQSNGQIIISGSGGSGGGGGGSSTTIITASYRRYARYHDTAFNPVALWQLSGNLLDSGPSAYDLVVATGTERYAPLVPGIVGAYFDAYTKLSSSVVPANLLLTGAVTVECIVSVTAQNTSSQYICILGSTGENYNTNYVWSVSVDTNSNALRYFAETGSAGTNILYSLTASLPTGMPIHLALVRGSDYQVTFYANGEKIGSSSSALTNPSITSATYTGRVQLGGDDGVTQRFQGTLASLKVINGALTAQQVRREFEYTLGPMYGILNNETADISASYIVIGTTGSLPNERNLAVSTDLTLTDGGPGSTVTLGVNNNRVATLTGSIFSGPVSASAGLSGSLQQVAPGLSYLVGAGNVTITSRSNGQIIVSGSGRQVLHTLNIFAGAVSTAEALTGSKLSIGGTYFNSTHMTSLVGSKAYKWRAIVFSSETPVSAAVDLYDVGGVIGGSPAVVSGTPMSSSLMTPMFIEKDITTVLSGMSSGILEARLWKTVSGSVTSSVTCLGAWIDVEVS